MEEEVADLEKTALPYVRRSVDLRISRSSGAIFIKFGRAPTTLTTFIAGSRSVTVAREHLGLC